MKKIILLILILLLTGCYDYVEIDNLAIISGIIIDYDNNDYVLTSQIIENDKETEFKTFTTKGNTIEECIFKLSKVLNKDIFISHLKSLIITENIIKNKIDFYDYFVRDPKSKMNFHIYYINSKYKDKLFNINNKIDSSLYLEDLIKSNNNSYSSSTPLLFMDYLYKELNFGIDNIYPNIEIKKNNDKDNIYLNNLISFSKNNEQIILNDSESIFYNILTNNLNKTVINIPCEDKSFSLIINNSKTKYSFNNILNFNISLKGKLSSYNCKQDLDKKETIDLLSKYTNAYVKHNVNKIVNKSKDNNIDFLGIGNYIYKHNNKYIKKLNSNNYLTDINHNIKVKTIITSIGEMRK